MSRWRAALPRLEKRNGLTPPSVNIQPSCPACDIFHGQNDTYPDLSVHLRRETYVGKRIAKGDGACGQDRCLGSHGDGRKRSRLEATLRVCAVNILVSDMARYYFEVHKTTPKDLVKIVRMPVTPGHHLNLYLLHQGKTPCRKYKQVARLELGIITTWHERILR
jgi:hypothetical protein